MCLCLSISFYLTIHLCISIFLSPFVYLFIYGSISLYLLLSIYPSMRHCLSISLNLSIYLCGSISLFPGILGLLLSYDCTCIFVSFCDLFEIYVLNSISLSPFTYLSLSPLGCPFNRPQIRWTALN